MKLSIITINYNNKTGLEKTILSVRSQTYQNFEWIIIDGGSTDGGKELIEKYQEYFAYWCSEPDKGVYNAMNKGVSQAHGDYLLFLNSGDCLHNSTVLEIVCATGIQTDILYGDVNFIKNSGNVVFHYPDKLTTHFLLYRSLGHPACFIKASLLKEKGYREDFKIISDWYRFVEWFREGRSFVHIPIIVADFDTTGISSKNQDTHYCEKEMMFKELFGKDNRLWIKESIDMQKMYERYDNEDFANMMVIRNRGGRRLRLLRYIMNFLSRK